MTKISVIIPYYNQGRYLHTAVQSALLSYSGDLEIIVVDDGSTESQADYYCAQVKNLDVRVRVIRKANGGLSSARNVGLDAAQGDYIQLLDCDGVLLPEKIDKQISHLNATRDKLVSVTGYFVCNEWMRDFRDESHTVTRFPLTLRSFLLYWERGFSVPIHCGLFHKSVFDQIRFNESLYGEEDWIFWATLAGNYRDKLIYSPIPGVVYRFHSSGMTRARDKMGESWMHATRILAAQYGCEYPEFEAASKQWHKKFYDGARLSRITGQSVHKTIPVQTKASDVAVGSDTTLCFEKISSATDQLLLSFVVPVFNHSKYLRQCIETLVHQKPTTNFEIVVFVDRSTELRTIDMLRGIDCRDVAYRVFLNDTNYDISVIENLAVEHCRGDYITFVDCDGLLEPYAWETLLQFIGSEDAPDYIFTDTNYVEANGEFVDEENHGCYPWIKRSALDESNQLLGMVTSPLKVIRKSLYSTMGGSNIQFFGAQDWELARRIISRANIRCVNKALYNNRIYNGSLSTTQLWIKNILRRKYMTVSSAVLETNTVIELNEVSLEEIPYISKLFLDGVRFLFRAGRDPLSVSEIDILVEFNSYFDTITLPVTETAMLMGYLWDYRIVRPQR